ncbi:hypothetical protein GWI33_017148 [Rhynchophorus ferrugineus]|uniref:Uncharacterized protein n=1 Tax=Rhynchophorus ferrugineus TaxID=354439 RepID=A0A834HZN7_RHYFE|nr:hypothetical protein GWI33_017148 [Rhynchophorus ferrugineus]
MWPFTLSSPLPSRPHHPHTEAPGGGGGSRSPKISIWSGKRAPHFGIFRIFHSIIRHKETGYDNSFGGCLTIGGSCRFWRSLPPILYLACRIAAGRARSIYRVIHPPVE